MLSKLLILRWSSPSSALKKHHRLMSHLLSAHSSSDSDDIHDPPFSFTPKPPSRDTHKPRKEDKNAKGGLLETGTNSKKEPTFPIVSELPFDFRYSYSETNPNVKPIGYREPIKYSPFGPGRLDREWTGDCAPAPKNVDLEKVAQQRQAVLGEPLTEEEVSDLVEKYRHIHCPRQINLGRGGVTHNSLDDIHNHWRRAEAVRIKCLGLPTLDMDNVCFHLEDKSGGKVIYRYRNILLLYRGRNYDPENRPVIPLMLFKPLPPRYPKLVKNVADGITSIETKMMRNKGLNMPPLMKLTRNGVYVTVVEKVRAAFETEEVVRLDCAFVGNTYCKKIVVKLQDLVPCIPILLKREQIILWRGKQDT